MKKKIKKALLPIDEATTCGTLAYGYTNKKDAIRDIQALEPSEAIDETILFKVRIMKHTKNGEDYYFWGSQCHECGSENKGVWGFFYGE